MEGEQHKTAGTCINQVGGGVPHYSRMKESRNCLHHHPPPSAAFFRAIFSARALASFSFLFFGSPEVNNQIRGMTRSFFDSLTFFFRGFLSFPICSSLSINFSIKTRPQQKDRDTPGGMLSHCPIFLTSDFLSSSFLCLPEKWRSPHLAPNLLLSLCLCC
jgi:hypothetical protein